MAEQETLPFQPHSAESRDAAVSMVGAAARCRSLVYEALLRRPMTDEEGQEETGLAANTYRPRRRELEQAEMVRKTTQRRKTKSGRTAAVWAGVL